MTEMSRDSRMLEHVSLLMFALSKENWADSIAQTVFKRKTLTVYPDISNPGPIQGFGS